MEDKKSEALYRRAIKDFPDRSLPPKNYSISDPLRGLDIVSKSPILPFEKLSDVVGRSATEPDTVFIAPPEKKDKLYTPSKKNTYTLPEVAAHLRNAMGIKIGEEIKARDIDPYTGIPTKSGFLSSLSSAEEEASPGLSGYYQPSTGNIRMRTGLSPEDYIGTYAHEAGHKIKAQGLGIEGKKNPSSYAQRILRTDFMDPSNYLTLLNARIKKGEADPFEGLIEYTKLFEKPVTGPMDVAKLVDKYYSGHHRADEPKSWETQALQNLKTKGILEEPFTPEARPENIPDVKYKNKYYEILNKRSK